MMQNSRIPILKRLCKYELEGSKMTIQRLGNSDWVSIRAIILPMLQVSSAAILLRFWILKRNSCQKIQKERHSVALLDLFPKVEFADTLWRINMFLLKVSKASTFD